MAKVNAQSKRFENLSFELYEKLNEEGRVIHIVSHADLMDAIVNKIPEGFKCKYDFSNIQVLGNTHFLAKAIIEDNVTRIVEYGEVTQSTLSTKIAKDYPATMAMNRAFDRAAIKYFGLGKKVYSDNEISPSTLKDAPAKTTTTATTAPAPTNKEEKVHNAASKDTGFNEVDTSTPPEPATPAKTLSEKKKTSEKTSSLGQPKPQETNRGTNAETAERLRVLSSTKVGFMKYANKTFEEVLKDDEKTMKWIAREVKSGPNASKADLVREYLNLKNINYAS